MAFGLVGEFPGKIASFLDLPRLKPNWRLDANCASFKRRESLRARSFWRHCGLLCVAGVDYVSQVQIIEESEGGLFPGDLFSVR